MFLLKISDAMAQCFVNENTGENFGYSLYSTSGNEWIDQAYSQHNYYLMGLTGLSVKFGFYDDSSGLNAFATKTNSNGYHGETYFGINLLNKYIIENGEEGLQNMSWILAHEYGHIIQFNKGQAWKKTKWNELQSDFFAGAVTAQIVKYTIDSGNLEFASEESAIKYISNYTERAVYFFDSLGDTNFGSPQHHGKPLERFLAFSNGFRMAMDKKNIVNAQGNIDIDNLWGYSLNYIDGLMSTGDFEDYLDKGKLALENGFNENAEVWLKKASDNESVEAKRLLGDLKRGLYGGKKNEREALKWYKDASNNGDGKAMFKIGSLYELGFGVSKNIDDAIFWFKKAGQAGYAEGYYRIGTFYYYQKGGLPDDNQKIKYWWRKSCEKGFKEACTELEYLD